MSRATAWLSLDKIEGGGGYNYCKYNIFKEEKHDRHEKEMQQED